MTDLQVGEDIWIDEALGTVMSISEPFASGNMRYEDGTAMRVREYVILVPEGY